MLVDGVTMDIGVSSMQLDQPGGFSFQTDGPLDMRRSQEGETAADFVNHADESAIADVLYDWRGREPHSRRGRAGDRPRRGQSPGRASWPTPSARAWLQGARQEGPGDETFQAIRIHINRELGELADGLAAAERDLKPLRTAGDRDVPFARGPAW